MQPSLPARSSIHTVACATCALLLAIGCDQQQPDPNAGRDTGASTADAGPADGSALDRALDAATPRRDASQPDTSFWTEDAGVAYESYLPCLSGAAITLTSCFLDARDRVAAVAPLGLPFSRAAGSFDQNGEVPESRPGLVYQFCRPDGDFYECLSVEYWWSGVTAQISTLRLHRAREGAARSRDLTQPPDSTQIISTFLSTDGCEIGAAGYADINLFNEAGSDRIQVSSDTDSLLLADPDLSVVQDLCQP